MNRIRGRFTPFQAGLIAVVVIVVLTVLMAVTPAKQHLGM